jgi:hypothetical protein
MITSRFYYKNIIRRAELGLGDGTVYASATGATPDQDAKTFTLSGLSIIADFGADVDDKFNSYILYFPDSGNIYHIIDWSATGDRATVFEVPVLTDIGACEFRINLWANTTAASNPVHLLADGKRSTIWKGSAPNQSQAIRMFMPNLIDDGGFEAQSVGNVQNPWIAASALWQISATSPLLGSRMVTYTQGGALVTFKQYCSRKIEKGRTYRILFKAAALGADPVSNPIRIYLVDRNWTVDIENGYGWWPALTTTPTWFENTFTPDFSTDNWLFAFVDHAIPGSWGSCTGFNLDEIYLYEDISVDRLIVLDHGMDNGIIESLYGFRCNAKRNSFSYSDDGSANLMNDVAIHGTEAIVESASESSYPAWEIVLGQASGVTYSAASIFLGSAMAFGKQNIQPFDPDAEAVGGLMSETRSGRRVFYPDFYRGGPFEMTFSKINSTFYTNLTDWWEEVGRTKFPFLYCFDEENYPEKIKLLRCESDFMFSYDPVLRSGTIRATEEL